MTNPRNPTIRPNAIHTPTPLTFLTPWIIPILIYTLSITLYIHPLTSAPTPSEPPSTNARWNLIYTPKPQLDEMHIMSPQQHDISPQATTSWKEAWYNDYWGRPLSDESSHKSWRPISIWSFRFGKGGTYGRWFFALLGRCIGGSVENLLGLFGLGFRNHGQVYESDPQDGGWYYNLASELFVYRFVNVMIHAALVQVVGALALLLFFHPDRYSSSSSSSSNSNNSNRNNSNNNNKNPPKSPSNQQLITKYISQLLFAIHPVHVEAVANVANRPHILALLFNTTISDPDVPLGAVAILATCGLLTAETAIFQFPAMVCTMTAIRYREFVETGTADRLGWWRLDGMEDDATTTEEEEKKTTTQKQQSPLMKTFTTLLPRYALLVMISVTYLLYRHYNDTLSIPTGLIRPAENPFYAKLDSNEWTLRQRITNYSYVLSLHIMKSFGVDLVGFSHEYGFDCIPEITSLSGDARLLLPVLMVLVFAGIAVWGWCGWKVPSSGGGSSSNNNSKRTRRRQKEHEDKVHRILSTLVFFSWMATLFPISGILKVGTFVADRIVVASSVGTCIFAGRLLALWMTPRESNEATSTSTTSTTNNKEKTTAATTTKEETTSHMSEIRNTTKSFKMVILFISPCFITLAMRTHSRAAAWMDSVPLFESSLVTCPRSIKSNLEISKIYSGLVPHMVDYEKSLKLIRTAQSIDPTYCDVHQQYSHVYFHQQKYILFEREMAQSLRCPFTMGQAMGNWNKYWKVVLKQDASAKGRYDKYMASIQEEVARREEEEGGSSGDRKKKKKEKEEGRRRVGGGGVEGEL